VNSDLLEKARELGVDLASTLEDALALEVRRRQREAWLEENREAIEKGKLFGRGACSRIRGGHRLSRNRVVSLRRSLN